MADWYAVIDVRTGRGRVIEADRTRQSRAALVLFLEGRVVLQVAASTVGGLVRCESREQAEATVRRWRPMPDPTANRPSRPVPSRTSRLRQPPAIIEELGSTAPVRGPLGKRPRAIVEELGSAAPGRAATGGGQVESVSARFGPADAASPSLPGGKGEGK